MLCRTVGLKVEVDGRATNNKETTEIVAGTANGLSRAARGKSSVPCTPPREITGPPGVATKANDREGAAVDTDLAGDRAKYNTEETSQEADQGVVGLLDTVACKT